MFECLVIAVIYLAFVPFMVFLGIILLYKWFEFLDEHYNDW